MIILKSSDEHKSDAFAQWESCKKHVQQNETAGKLHLQITSKINVLILQT